MIPALANRGFGWGSGVIDPDGKRFIVNIPKNASSYIHDWSKHQGWRTTNAHNEKSVREMIVILRDPVDRWISGIAQYIVTYILNVYGFNGPIYPDEPVTEHDQAISAQEFLAQYTPSTERLLFDVLSRFDDHVWPQNEIIQGILEHVPRKFFHIHNIDTAMCDYLGWTPHAALDRNSGLANADMQMLQEFFKDRVYRKRPELLARIRKHYRADYALLARIEELGP